MQTIYHDLSEPIRDIQLLVLADLHIGDANCDERKVQELIRYVNDTDNCYTILDGDLMNNAIRTGVSDVYGEKMSPMEQLTKVQELFKPLAEKGKILAILSGNHEARSGSKTVGLDPTRLFARQLGLEDIYSEGAAVVLISCGKNARGSKMVYSIYCHHGIGGGRTIGSKLNSLERLGHITDSDVICAGHVHAPAVFRQGMFRIVPQKKSLAYVERIFVNTASCLSYGGYGEAFGYQPTSNTYPIITLSSTEHKVSVQI